jgi:hypothetical protein
MSTWNAKRSYHSTEEPLDVAHADPPDFVGTADPDQDRTALIHAV